MNTNDLYPMYGMWHQPFWQTTFFYVVVAGVLSLIFGAMAWFMIKRYRGSKQEKPLPWQTALAGLQELQRDLFQKSILGKTFYFRLTWVFKQYLHERYGFDVYGKTDQELFTYLEDAGLGTDLVHDLRVIFEGSLDIKFAHQEAVFDRMNRDLVMSLDFVKKTVPAEHKIN